jgi:hypothetical protein
MTTLDIRYRRLMFAYPREYRRHRGAEIASTLAEMAPEGRRWPRGRDAVSLLRHGMRARLGRPRSRIIVPVALLAVLIGGFASAGLGARVGWIGSGPMTDSTASALASELQRNGADVAYLGTAPAHDGAFTPSPTELGWPTTSQGSVTPQVEAALTKSGWRVTRRNGDAVTLRRGSTAVAIDDIRPVIHYEDIVRDGTPCPPSTYWTPHLASVTCVVPVGTPDHSGIAFAVTVYRVTPWPVPVLMVAFGLIGAVLTYLLVGWISRRSARLADGPQRLILAGSVVTLIAVAPAAIVCAACLWEVAVTGVRVPLSYWAGFSAGGLRPAALVAAVALAATAWLTIAVHPPEPSAPTIAT